PQRRAAPPETTPTAIHRCSPRKQAAVLDGTGRSWSASPLGGPRLRRALDGLADPRIGAAAADVPRQCLVDIGVPGRRYLREQRGRRHDLTGLTVAALHDLHIEPRLLDLLADRGGADCLDGGDRMAYGGADRHYAGSPGNAIQMHRAGAAERDAAAELGAVHPEHVAQDPEQGHVRWDVDLVRLAVDSQRPPG